VPTLLIVHHTTSPATHMLFDAVVAGATDPQITAVDVLAADGYLLGTPANLGYISGALKHFFDQIYYPCLDSTTGRPYGLYVHGNNDTAGAMRAVEMITTGLQWRTAQKPVSIVGEPSQDAIDACWELGAGLAALLAEGLA
jgi:NAD(P)H-dependent FMN reductase